LFFLNKESLKGSKKEAPKNMALLHKGNAIAFPYFYGKGNAISSVRSDIIKNKQSLGFIMSFKKKRFEKISNENFFKNFQKFSIK